ncbi:MAG: YfhO family protein, partial [Bacteroidia bacterium]|nr:YfhO family protein [Bacteroidia bacterium]
MEKIAMKKRIFPESSNKQHSNAGTYILLSAMIPLLGTLFSFAALGIAPFGDRSLVLSDANGYYMPYLSYCKSIFQGNHDLFYSFSQDIGGGIAATIWPYLLNPFSWIISFFDYELYAVGYSIGVLLITALYGLFMYLLLADMKGHKIENLLISTCYAMSGFAVCFNINTAFFFGGPLCLPLMVLGLRKIFRNESPTLYIFSIAYPVVLQIQMGFAVCMAAVLFFLAKLFVEENIGNKKGLWIRFILSSISGGLIGAIIWIPEMLIIRQGRGSFSLEDFVFSSNAPLLQFGARLFTGANSVYQISNGYPAVFCGILPLALVILYFLNKNICTKKKIACASLLTVYIFGFGIRTFTSIFQGFTHANWFNYRFSFVFIFILLLAASEQFNRLDEISERDL